ncbi:hypothetical protein C8F04DRAFT_1214956 [Mycena alexandri]|uniref:Uncharacterized protein n=1 Tax=Mycena alexandri TaxID=1745969 RepID=A0AAD6WNC6_9AGAR|nr:hypothetical protein C8F04DRAFT_1214956 [Mycena alexandri]
MAQLQSTLWYSVVEPLLQATTGHYRPLQATTGKIRICLAAIAGYVPSDMVKCLAAFIDFCYTVRRNCITTEDFPRLKNQLARFHQYRAVFIDCGVRTDISLPRQHSLVHYIPSIVLFGSPNGLCSSITESKHIKAVKEPWRRSSRYKALAQMLIILTRLDKLAALRTTLRLRGMLTGTASSTMMTGRFMAQNRSPTSSLRAHNLATHTHHPQLPLLLRRFLHEELHGPPDPDLPPLTIDACPEFDGRIDVHHSAVARFYAPSDLGGAGGMYREQIRSNPNWHGYARRDTVLIDVGSPVMGGIVIGRVQLFFSFAFADRLYECALVHWLVPVGVTPDPDTGMWVVEPERERGALTLAIVNLDAIARAAHLLPVYGTAALPENFHFSDSLDAFDHYFVNPYADHHTHEFLSVD